MLRLAAVTRVISLALRGIAILKLRNNQSGGLIRCYRLGSTARPIRLDIERNRIDLPRYSRREKLQVLE